ncbi:MAG: hypothetical protein HUN04_02355 [Desulfobacter sp.]|nr:MAG: hypothetical protein HUN04_02355 [Desulfobacter sp.]
MMKAFSCLLLLACLLAPAGLFAANNDTAAPITITLQKYKNDGYSILGPVQYLEKTKDSIVFYRHPPITYTRLRIIKPIGVPTSIKRGDVVYVLSKRGNVVLIRIKKKEIKDA